MRSLRHDQSSAQDEVLVPNVAAWVIEFDGCSGLRINRREISSLVLIAEDAGQGQVCLDGLPAMFLRNDVVHLMQVKRNDSGQKAVLTPAVRPLADEPSKRGRDIG